MPKYLMPVSYTVDGAKGILKDGAAGRRAAITTAIESLGGTVESFYYAYGDNDAFLTVDLPSETAALALAVPVVAAGGAKFSTIQLFTPEEVDQALQTSPDYRPPGQ